MSGRNFDLSDLSEGISNMPRRLTRREWLADHSFFYLQLVSKLGFIAGGIIGYAVWGWIGCFALAGGCLLLGMLIRRSVGLRGPDPFHGWYRRMRERAEGSRAGLLEWMMEGLRGNKFTRAKCRGIAAAYDTAMAELRSATSREQQLAILKRLDSETKRISYSA